MRHRTRQPVGGMLASAPLLRLGSMLMFLVVLGMMYRKAKAPGTWGRLAPEQQHEAESPKSASAATPLANTTDVVVAGATDRDEGDTDEVRRMFEAVSDKSPLSAPEMPAYWRLMAWTRAQTFDEVGRRALRDPVYTQLWEQSDKYRGKPVRLRLHIKRILQYEAPQNSAGVAQAYEAWGSTDESKSYPYVVVFADIPPGMKIGADVHEEGDFVGYFLKTMAYATYNATRSAPLLVGRLHAASGSVPAHLPRSGQKLPVVPVAGGLLAVAGVIGLLAWRDRPRPKPHRVATRLDDNAVAEWLSAEQPPSQNLPARSASTDEG